MLALGWVVDLDSGGVKFVQVPAGEVVVFILSLKKGKEVAK